MLSAITFHNSAYKMGFLKVFTSFNRDRKIKIACVKLPAGVKLQFILIRCILNILELQQVFFFK